MEELTALMEEERELFERLKESVIQQKMALIDRDLNSMNEALLVSEKLAFEIESIDKRRKDLFEKLKENLGLLPDASLTDVLNKLDDPEREVFLNSISGFLRTVNDLIIELQGMKEMLNFEQSYFDFLRSLITDGGRGIYSNKGKYRGIETRGSFDSRW